MKLLIIAPVIYPVHPDNRYAGIEKLAGYFAAGLNALGHQVSVASTVGSAFPRGIRHIPVQPGDFVQGELVAWHVFRPEIRGFDAILDFSHSHFAMREMDLPAVSWVWHDPKIMQPPQPAYNVLALSQWQADRLLQYQKVTARVFDCHCGFPVNSDQVGDHFVFIGQATATKGLLQAVELCKELGVPLDAIGAVRQGDQAYFEQCQAAAGPLTELWGEVSEPVKISLLARARGLLHPLAPGYVEAHSHKCVDSLLAGVPVVSYSTGAMPEVITHGIDGFLAEDRHEFKSYMLRVGELERGKIRERAISRWGVRNVAERAVALMGEVAAGLRWG